ncbi:hypothetical protein VUR80DRAFT_1681 [Thermomyces stellatus]
MPSIDLSVVSRNSQLGHVLPNNSPSIQLSPTQIDMLRRSTARSGSSLSRRKSAASVRSAVQELEYITPADAIRDAHVAATVSFERARDRTRASVIPYPRHSFDDNVPDTAGRPRAELHHRRSVRFVQPVVGSRSSVSSRACDTRDYPGRSRPLNDLHVSESQLLSYAQPLCYGPGAQGREDAYARALQASDDCYTPEDDIGSAPSSYRRLRKCKSMFAPQATFKADLRADCRFSSHQGFRAHTLRTATPDNKENRRPSRRSDHLRTPKSMSFLKSLPDRPVRKLSQQENDAAVEMARDMFKKTVVQQQRLKSYPSRLFRSKKRSILSSETGTSIPSSSNSTVPLSLSSSNFSISKGNVSAKVRKVSSNLKSRLKKLLHINTKDCSESSLSGSSAPMECNSTSLEPTGDQGPKNRILPFDGGLQGSTDYTLNSVASRLPSFREVPSSLKSRQCSWESLHSDQRSTEDGYINGSWTNPGLNLAPGAPSWEWEHHRLSVIKEFGNHLSSPDHRNPARVSGNQSHPGIDDVAASTTSLSASGPIVSSERVYSALMRHQREKTAHTMEGSAAVIDPLPANCQTAPEPLNCSPMTIRCVKPEDDVFVDKFRSGSRPGSRNPTSRGSRTSSAGSVVRKPLPSSSRVQAIPGPVSTPHDHLFRTGSPYRRSLQEAIRAVDYKAPNTPGASYMLSMPDINLPPRCPSAPESAAENGLDYTSSVYSSATASPRSSLVGSTGKRAPSPYPAFGRAAGVRHEACFRSSLLADSTASDVSSVEWKSWLSSKVEKLEDPGWGRASSGNATSKAMAPAKSCGHVRQGAEINSSDTGSPACSPDQNTAHDSPQRFYAWQDAESKSVPHHNPDASEDKPPNHEIRVGILESVRPPESPPPPIPTKSSLRSGPSLPCIQTPSSRIKSRLPKSTPRPSSFLDSASPGLKRRPGVRLARKARAGLKHGTALSCIGDGTSQNSYRV